MLEAGTSEHQGPGPGGLGEDKGTELLETVLSTELQVLFVKSTALPPPCFLYQTQGLWMGAWALAFPLVWLWTCLALAHLGGDQMAQAGWCNSLPGSPGQKAATDPVPGGPRSEG